MPIGIFALDESNRLLTFKPFPKDPAKMASLFARAQQECIEEELELAKELELQGYGVAFGIQKPGVEVDKRALNYVREHFRELALNYYSELELNELLSLVAIELTKLRMRKAMGRDKFVIHAIRVIEELDKCINQLATRLCYGYGLHFPELEEVVQDHRQYAELVLRYGRRQNIPGYEELASQSTGAELEDADLEHLRSLAEQVMELYELRERAIAYLEQAVRSVAPNLTALTDPLLASKLISAAGSLERLAHLPSSTVQLLGSEKALFRYLRGKGKSPKYGYIFLHPLIQRAPPSLRGRIARALASKLTIAARIDYYTKEDRSAKLKADLEQKLRSIHEAQGHQV